MRHGQASFGASNYDQLSELGKQQSQWLGEYFRARDYQFEHVWRGDLQRHAQTAAGIVAHLPGACGQSVCAGFNEFDFASICQAYLQHQPQHQPQTGASRQDYYRLLKRAMLAWSQDQLSSEHLSESWSDFRQRVQQSLNTIMQQHEQGPILLVSSGGVIAMMMSLALNLEAHQVVELNLQIRNSSVSHFHFNQQHIRLSSFNTVGHLDQPDRLGAITYS